MCFVFVVVPAVKGLVGFFIRYVPFPLMVLYVEVGLLGFRM